MLKPAHFDECGALANAKGALDTYISVAAAPTLGAKGLASRGSAQGEVHISSKCSNARERPSFLASCARSEREHVSDALP